jgi:hypothetical protein
MFNFKFFFKLILTNLILLFASNSYASCQAFVQSFKDRYYFANTYLSYACAQSVNASGIPSFVITGRPGTNSTDRFVLTNKSNCIFRTASNGVNEVFQVGTWSEIAAKQNDPEIENLCRSNFTGGDKEGHLLKYKSNLGDCNSTLKLISKTERDDRKLELAKLAIRQGCNDENTRRYVNLLESKLAQDRAAQAVKENNDKQFCVAQQKSCQKITNLSVGFKEKIARSQSVSPDTIKFQRLEVNSCGCSAVIYIPRGLMRCSVTGISGTLVSSANCF